MLPLTTGMTTRLVTACPAGNGNVDRPGTAAWSGNAVSVPECCALTTVTSTTTAVTLALASGGTSTTLVTAAACDSTVCPLPPRPERVSRTRVGPTGRNVAPPLA